MRSLGKPQTKTCSAISQTALTALLLASGASAQTWTEFGDAGDTLALAQTTRGPDGLTRIVGSTLGVDERDAYCIRVTDPATFSASTVNDGTDFDTRLFLFGRHDVALLANDDLTSTETKSLLTGTATDGSLFQLLQGGEYTLVISGFGEDATDATSTSLFDFDSDHTWVHAADNEAGRMRDWQGDGDAGSYQIDLTGAAPCAHRPDIVYYADNHFTLGICRDSVASSNMSCTSANPPLGGDQLSMASGYFDQGAQLDLIITAGASQPRAQFCAGSGGGDLAECVDGPPVSSFDTFVADINGDQIDDLINRAFLSRQVVLCPGDGEGRFPFCSQPFVTSIGLAMTPGHVDDDQHLDLIGATFDFSRAAYCLGTGDVSAGWVDCVIFDPGNDDLIRDVAFSDLNGDGVGEAIFVGDGGHRICTALGTAQQSCISVAAAAPVRETLSVTTGDLDHDGDLDAAFGNDGIDRICLFESSELSVCSDLGASEATTAQIELEDLDGDSNLDVVRRTTQGLETCRGVGDGTFEPCELLLSVDFSFRRASFVVGEFGTTLFADSFESGDTTSWLEE